MSGNRTPFIFLFRWFYFLSEEIILLLFFVVVVVILGTGPKRVYQFKLIEKEPWGNEPKQLCKLGSTDLRVIKFLRNIIAERVADKF